VTDLATRDREGAAPPALWNVPNILSLSRVPLTAVLCAFVECRWWLPALIAFGVAALTDWLDGWWARKFDQMSAVGRALDPLTDKVLIGSAFIFLLPVPEAGLAAWMVAVMLSRELLITGIRGIVEGAGKKFGADWFGKLKTVLQCVVLGAVLFLLTCRQEGWVVELDMVILRLYQVLLWAMLVATVGSGIQYLVKAYKLLK
jgi:CDP-diacylglycerol---glycerol-3-phosphate 3-phosphatidyltransferase